MKLPLIRFTGRGRALLPLLALCMAAPAAATHPGPVGNVLLKNPYADPVDGAFGRGVVAGDFDGDGVGDLAVADKGGSQLRVLLGTPWAVGAVTAIKFLATTVDSPFHNYALASGDFDGDGRDEIAVGAAGTSSGGNSSAGAVYVLNRSGGGTWSVQEEIRAGIGGYPGASQTGADMGNSLAAGDFDGDGFTDLAIGIRGQRVDGLENAGAVMVTYGTANGIAPSDARIFNRNNDGLGFDPAEDDYFGWSVAAGDFDDDGDDDLAIGVWRGICSDDETRSGAVVEMNGSGTGITSVQSRSWRPGSPGVLGTCSTTGNFGEALAVGYFDRLDGHADLAIGAPGSSGGAVHIVYGSDTGLTTVDDQRFAAPALPGGSSIGSRFGAALAAGDLGHGCGAGLSCAANSLAIGAPFATVAGLAGAGAVWVIDAPVDRLEPGTAHAIVANASLEIGAPHENDQFGNALAIGDFNDDALADLAIGVYLYDDGSDTDAGAVQLLYQSDFIFLGVFDAQSP
jgi:hypothetical protein